jgi:NAD(P)-dependent dehydrogenase (short-subunit alcohol dehydrogenase family)
MDERKVCVITGALGALGIPTATELARRGYHVVLLGRGPERLAQARARVAKESGTGSVDTCECDLGSFQSIRAAAKRLGERYPKIHLLINNAAVYSAARKLSADGCELMVAVNHLAPFLLTLSLEAPLTAAGDARVICMTMASGKPAATSCASWRSGGAGAWRCTRSIPR